VAIWSYLYDDRHFPVDFGPSVSLHISFYVFYVVHDSGGRAREFIGYTSLYTERPRARRTISWDPQQKQPKQPKETSPVLPVSQSQFFLFSPMTLQHMLHYPSLSPCSFGTNEHRLGDYRHQDSYQKVAGFSSMSAPIRPHENDVLMGRGGKNNQHSGNEKLRGMARLEGENYRKSSKKGKSYISRQLVQRVRSLNPPGR